ncbi:MAG: Na+/H+ antiporter NhaC family protein, partial [Oscillospiraceae bacterium]
MHIQKSAKKLVPFVLTILALVALMATSVFAEGEAEYVSMFHSTIWALIPPVLAIALALITKEVYTSLFL